MNWSPTSTQHANFIDQSLPENMEDDEWMILTFAFSGAPKLVIMAINKQSGRSTIWQCPLQERDYLLEIANIPRSASLSPIELSTSDIPGGMCTRSGGNPLTELDARA
ncbi:hypothetical protein ACJRO7_019975 [Eucalyptus globulus]|uniref:Uncharacterized protein n=1 Tax=Eucalyptus globulus TaxID=34317 RepID=A0ABD3KI40_EUCGL